jgi:energy-coupling factor transporter ATP-binding protein EcfA2
MKIELKETLERHLKEGINLFLGAGFPIYSQDIHGNKLPLGFQLNNELVKEFNCPNINDLTKVCTIIDSIDSDGLKHYLSDRFNVSKYDKIYDTLINIKCPRIFTTNIDNLVDKIFDNTTAKYLNNVFINGSCYLDKNCVDYIPIHGSVEMPDMKYLFNKQEVSGSYRTQINAWISLTHAASQIPSIFLGYSLDDVGAIESLFGNQGGNATQKEKWILLHKEDPGSEAYFKALGFKIIVGDMKEFLEYIEQLNINTNIIKPEKKKDSIEEIYPEASIPKNNYIGRIRQIDEFFLGAAPIWSDILSNRIHITHHLDEISNLLEKNKNVIVTGIPASGKSTLLLQLAKKKNTSRRVLIFNSLTINKSNIIKKEINSPTIILVDNFTSDIDAFINLATNPKIKLVGFDRYYNVDISVHKIPYATYETYDVSDLTPQDIQGIYNSIPLSIRKPRMITTQSSNEIPSVFEIVNYNINKPDINDRYKDILIELNTSDPLLLDLLIMTCYMHSCRIPVSFEVANSFLGEEASDYDEVLELMDSLRGMVQEALGDLVDELDDDQDYYQPRSQILAETIITQTKPEYFKRVFEQFHANVTKHIIPNYHIFKRSGYDAYYVSKAYSNWQEGLEFYETAYFADSNPFLLQQCALYLLKKRRYTEAAFKIDKALQIAHKRFFSIDNTHAIILFKANINANGKDPDIRITLDKSMKILKECYHEDQRKIYHAVTFAEQALEYFTKYADNIAIDYMKLAYEWLKEVQSGRKYHRRSKDLLKQLEELL